MVFSWKKSSLIDEGRKSFVTNNGTGTSLSKFSHEYLNCCKRVSSSSVCLPVAVPGGGTIKGSFHQPIHHKSPWMVYLLVYEDNIRDWLNLPILYVHSNVNLPLIY